MKLERTPAVDRRSGRAARRSAPCRRTAAWPQHRLTRVLEGQVEVRRHPGSPGHRLDQRRAHLGGLQVGDPDPLDAVHRGQRGQQLLQQPEVAEVLAVGRGVLADQDDLTDALAGQPVRLGHQVLRRPGQERAAERRDGTEAHRRSQPEASLSGATGPAASRRRSGAARTRARPRAAGPGCRRRAGRPRCGSRRRVRAGGRPRRPGGWPATSAAAAAGPGAGARADAGRPAPRPAGPRCRHSRRSRAPRLGQLGGQLSPYRSARQPAATTFAPPSAASSSSLTDSCLAASMNPQVLTSTTLAESRSASVQPAASSRAASSSESTSLRAQPSVIRLTVRGGSGRLRLLDTPEAYGTGSC